MTTDLHAIPPGVDNKPASPGPPRSDRYKMIILRCISYALPTVVGLLMVIFLAIPALMAPEFRLNPVSSLSSLNISTSRVTAQINIVLSIKNPSKLIAVKYTRMKLLLSFDGQLPLSRPSLVPSFTQGPGNVTTVPAMALTTLSITNDWRVKGLVSTLKGGVVSIDVVVKAKRRLHLGPWWVPVFDVYVSCMGGTFTAPTDSKGSGDRMILGGGALGCTPDIFTLLCCLCADEVDAQNEKLSMLNLRVWTGNRIKPSWTDGFKIRGALEEAGFVLLEDHRDRARLEAVGDGEDAVTV
ncbi:hypothetical protein NL676_008461 [Syzygium grande]|nr:hypothetical protein NL676_008461 [Syzygium grande]